MLFAAGFHPPILGFQTIPSCPVFTTAGSFASVIHQSWMIAEWPAASKSATILRLILWSPLEEGAQFEIPD